MTGDATSFRRLGRDTAIYSLGVVLARAVSFFMLPVYTRYLSTADYGVLQLLDMTTDIASILFVAGMTSGMALFYFQTNDTRARGTIVRTAFVLELSLALAAGLAVALGATWIWRYGLHGAGTPELVRIAGVNLALGTMASAPLSLLQLRQRSHSVVLINLVKLVMQLSLNILFVVVLKQGVRGILVTGVIVNSIIGLSLCIWLVRTTEGGPSWSIVRRLRRFGVPYQISAAGSFILAFGDRFFLQASHGASAVGLYGLAYQFGFLLYQLSADPLFRAWNPQRLQLLQAPKEIRDAKNAKGFLYFSLILVTVATGIGVFIRPVVQVMTTAPFHPAASLVPIILAAYVFGAWMDAVKFGIDASERTHYYTYANWISVALIMVLYAALIPPLAGLGAALATLIAFAVRFALVYMWSQRLWPLRYDWKHIVRLTVLGALTVAAATFLPTAGVTTLLIAGTALTAAYSIGVWTVVLGPEERSLLASSIRAPRRAFSAFRG